MISLDAMLRRMSKIAEKMFCRHGEIPSIWLLEMADGTQETHVTPHPPARSVEEAKDILAEIMRNVMRERGVLRYARAMEVWMAEYRDFDAARAQKPSCDPQRREAILLEAVDGTEHLISRREIIRPKHGTVYLGVLGEIERPRNIEGRWLDMLPRNASPRVIG
jgi:hypothetical protein